MNENKDKVITSKEARCIKINKAIEVFNHSELSHAYACVNVAECALVVIMTDAPMDSNTGDYEKVKKYVTDADHLDLVALYNALTDNLDWRVCIYAKLPYKHLSVKMGWGV